MIKIDRYIIIPLEIARNNDLTPNAKLLFGEILSLTKSTGKCYASNSYFARQMHATNKSIINWLRVLKAKNLITCELIYGNSNKCVEKRIITISYKNTENFCTTPSENRLTGDSEDIFTDNTTKNNNIKSNNIKFPKKQK